MVFVLLENQHCAPISASTVDGPPIPIDPCASAPKVNDPQFDSPCYNGGSCKSSAATGSNSSTSLNYTCLCPPGFAGPLCEINIDDCIDHQCQNGAMCVDGVNSYKCMCRDPTTSGEFCEQFVASSSAPTPSISFPYATSSAAALSTLVASPLALPIISSGGTASSGPLNELAVNQQHHQTPAGGGQQILARSADFSRAPSGSAVQNELLQQQQQQQHASSSASEVDQVDLRPTGSGCQRSTQRKYFDDGNGCQSVRLLKLSTCIGSCRSSGECCQPIRVKRRRVRMQCSDGASYVKTIDLIKKCSCMSDCSASPLSFPSASSSGLNDTNDSSMGEKTKSPQYFKYLTSPVAAAQAANNQQHSHHSRAASSGSSGSQDDQIMQITRLDAVD